MYYEEVRRVWLFSFFFQAEDGIRDLTVTGVQTCALPISAVVDGVFTDASNENPGDEVDGVMSTRSPAAAAMVGWVVVVMPAVDEPTAGNPIDRKSVV